MELYLTSQYDLERLDSCLAFYPTLSPQLSGSIGEGQFNVYRIFVPTSLIVKADDLLGTSDRIRKFNDILGELEEDFGCLSRAEIEDALTAEWNFPKGYDHFWCRTMTECALSLGFKSCQIRMRDGTTAWYVNRNMVSIKCLGES